MKNFTYIDSKIKHVDWKMLFDIASNRISKKMNIKHDIESMAHECVADVYEEIRKNGLRKSAHALLINIAQKKIADHYRNKKNYVKINGENIPRSITLDLQEWNQLEEKIATFETPEKLFEKTEKITMIKLFLEELEPIYRDVLELVNKNYSDKEIAKELNENYSTIRTKKYRGIKEEEQKSVKYKLNLKSVFT